MAGSGGVLKAIGVLIVFLCSLAELRFDPSLVDDDESRPQVALEPSPLPRVQVLREATIPIPKRWSTSRSSDVACHRFDAGERVRQVRSSRVEGESIAKRPSVRASVCAYILYRVRSVTPRLALAPQAVENGMHGTAHA
eukprot:6246496-Prymnesium_polylepis.1